MFRLFIYRTYATVTCDRQPNLSQGHGKSWMFELLCAGNVISLDTSFAALARFDARQLFDFSVSLIGLSLFSVSTTLVHRSRRVVFPKPDAEDGAS